MDFDLKFDSTRYTPEGWLVVDGFAASADDVYYYSDGMGGEYGEFRSFDAVEKSLPGFKNKDVTLKHPVMDGKQVFVNSDNYNTFSVGHIDGVPIMTDDKLVKATLVIKSKDAINAVENKGFNQLSVGYSRDPVIKEGVFDNKPYQVEQTNIQPNHVALVQNARGGSRLKLNFDSKEFLFDSIEAIEEPPKNQDNNNNGGRKTVSLKFDSHCFELEPLQEHVISEKFKSYESSIDEQKQLVNDSKSELETIKAQLAKSEEANQALQSKFDAQEKSALIKKVKRLFPDGHSFDGKDINQITEEAVKRALPDGNYDSKDIGYYQYKLEDILEKSNSNHDSQLASITGQNFDSGNNEYDSYVNAEMKALFGGKE